MSEPLHLSERARVLIADDEESIRFMISEIMTREGYIVELAADGAEAIEKASDGDFDLMILDIQMPKKNGLEVLREVRATNPGTAIVMITAHGTRQIALEAIKDGAFDYFTKPFEIDELRIVSRRALERRGLEKELKRLQARVAADQTYGKMIGHCEPMRQVYRLIDHVAPNDVTVLIRGESGTGKELVAREIHNRSRRCDGPFVSINCAAIPDALLESELFGHERGAFTGAIAAKPGRFEVASGGTILLDEIGDMPLNLQAKLLRVLQEREVERVGGSKVIPVDIRVIAATNQDLERAVERGEFRQDLFFRLNVVPVFLPPLRERVDDIVSLTQYFLERFASEFGKHTLGIDDAVLRRFVQYEWPGNIREMENVVQRSVIMSTGDRITADDLPDSLCTGLTPVPQLAGSPVDDTLLSDFARPLSVKVTEIVDSIERRAIELALAESGGAREETAELLGLSRKSLYNKMQKLGIGDE